MSELKEKYDNIESELPIVDELDVADTVSMMTGMNGQTVNSARCYWTTND